MTSITTRKSIEAKPNVAQGSQTASIAKRLTAPLVAAALPVLMTGCEAPLNLEAVAEEKAKQVRRTDQLLAVAANDEVILAVGSDGLLLSSPNDQLDWQRQILPGGPSLVDVEVCPDQSFVALSLDGRAWFSDRSARQWQASDIDTEESVLALGCGPDNSVWVGASFSTLLSSSDKGASWRQTSLDQDAQLTDIAFLGTNTIVVAGEFGLVTRSEDGGQSWSEPSYMPNDFYPQSIHFSSTRKGWAAGLSGQILHTSDGGVSWQQQTTATESPLYGFHAVGERLFVLGDHGTVLERQGSHWLKREMPKVSVYLRDAVTLDNQRLLVAGGWGSLFPVEIK